MHFFDRSLMLSTQNPLAAGAASVDYPFSGKIYYAIFMIFTNQL